MSLFEMHRLDIPWSKAITALLVLYISNRVWKIFKANQEFADKIPLKYSAFGSLTLLGASIPNFWWNAGLKLTWIHRSTLYSNAPFNTFALVPVFIGEVVVYSRSADVFHQVFGNNSVFVKPPLVMDDMKLFGENVIGSEGEAWKRHRRIAAPAFNQSTFKNVWTTTAHVYQQIIDNEGWDGTQEVRVPDINKITHKLALFIVATVGFGIPMSWNEPERDEKGRLSTQEMIFEVATTILFRSRIPKAMYYIGNTKLNKIDEAYNRFDELMRETIASREEHLRILRTSLASGQSEDEFADSIRDVLGRLLNSKLSEGKLALTDDEIIGNCFVILFAGHETTAGSLTATLTMLALHPEIQDWVYRSVKGTVGDREMTIDDYDSLESVYVCFLEALRLYSPVYFLFREATQDTVLSIPDRAKAGIVSTLPVKKGQNIIVDFIGMGHEPHVFHNPNEYRPRRWLNPVEVQGFSSSFSGENSPKRGTNTNEDIVGFSYGPRTCLGHKFAKLESVCFLASVLRDWRVVPEIGDGDTLENWRTRVLEPTFLVTMNFGTVPLKLVRR